MRVGNVVDLMARRLRPPVDELVRGELVVMTGEHHGPIAREQLNEPFVGHAAWMDRRRVERFHVRPFTEQCTTTAPFDMLVLNQLSRFHLASLTVEFSRLPPARIRELGDRFKAEIDAAVDYTRERLEDPPDVRDWTWSD